MFNAPDGMMFDRFGLLWIQTDGRTIFVGIQHPGGSWRETSGLPRSSIIAIRRDDGAVIA